MSHLIGSCAMNAAFSPADVSGLVLWVDGGLSAKTSSGGFVSQWNDLSGNNRHLTNAVGDTTRPNDNAGRTINGILAIDFDGNDCLATSGVGTLSTSFHAFIVAIIDTYAASDTFIDCGAGADADDGWRWRMSATTNRTALLLSNGVGTRASLDSGSGNTFTPGVATLYEAWATGDTAFGMAIDGVQTTGDPSIGSSGPDAIEIFALDTAAGAGGTDGCIAALLIYDHQLTGADLTNVRNYLNTRFAL
jgi:hypothetical protein